MILKADKMHILFGKTSGHKCKECNHLIKKTYDKTYNKCECYGTSSSKSTDWKVSSVACGLFNKEYNGKKAVNIRIEEPMKQIKGQISFL